MKKYTEKVKGFLVVLLALVLTAGGFAALRTEASKQARLDRAKDSQKMSVSLTSTKKEDVNSEPLDQEAVMKETVDYSFSRVGSEERTIIVGKDLDLEVRESAALREADLTWSIEDTSILAFDDNDTNGDDVEVIGKKAGTTVVSCYNEKTKETIKFTVTVKEKATTAAKEETTTAKKEETTEKKAETTTTKQPSSNTTSKDYSFSRKGNKERTVTVGKDLDLEVYKGRNLSDRDLSWSIKDTSILRFEENDSSGDDVEVVGKKAGKTTVSCYNEKTKETITFTVTVKEKAAATTAKKAETTTAKREETTTSSSSNEDYSFSRQGNKDRTVKIGKEIELEVKKGRDLRDRDLSWSIKNSSILAFDDNDTTGDDVELKALKAGTTVVSCYNEKTKESITFNITVEENKTSTESTISKVGSGTIYVELGDDEEVEVKATNVSSKNLKWTIKDTSILRFDDNESYGKEVDVKGLKLGETTVTCTNLLTNKSVSYKVIVTEDYDD